MISRLAGTLIEREATRVVVDCGGVGYDVVCSQYTMAALPADGERVVLHVFTQASENKIGLIGFADRAERALFDLLITVKNVGPSTAVAILSGSSPRDIATLIAREDVAGLTRIKGVGKKTAELLVVELHEKCELLVLGWNADGSLRGTAALASSAIKPVKKSGRHAMLDSVASALVGMGWRPAEADAAIAEITPEQLEDASIETLLRQALRSMPR
ncbi:MAG: Holliday junction branch migration protein RuvA [Proteobacteria bacterium]|nr:Holliday junction branch migration protein RuvA [Pseudomonadota bacterium]